METKEILDAAQVTLDGIAAALTFAEDQLEDLRGLIQEGTEDA